MARNTPASPKVRTPAALTPALEQLGRVLGALGNGEVTDPLALGITAEERDRFERAIAEAAARNGWFGDGEFATLEIDAYKIASPAAASGRDRE